jgi:LPS sulfotransferase NodH
LTYNRFVILGEQRTGSTYLQTLLASHRNILSFGELFNPSERIRGQIPRKIARPIELGEDPVEYLKNYVFKEYHPGVRAVGFRLFYTHARDDNWVDVWEYLRSRNIKIIHLKRRNLLSRYLSYELARRSNEWINYQASNGSYTEPINLDPQDCFRDFCTSLWYQERVDEFFKHNLKIEVIYEQLQNNLVEESKRIQDFLETDYQPLSSKTKKQRTKKKSEIITNYADLRRFLLRGLQNGKEWAKEEWLDFFDEASDQEDPITATEHGSSIVEQAPALPADQASVSVGNRPLITQEIRYQLPEAGEVFLVWGINDWQVVPKEIRPLGTMIKDKVMHTPMVREGDTFVAKVQASAGTRIVYGFLVTKQRDGVYINAIWHRHKEDFVITPQNDVTKVQAPSAIVEQIDK